MLLSPVCAGHTTVRAQVKGEIEKWENGELGETEQRKPVFPDRQYEDGFVKTEGISKGNRGNIWGKKQY